VTTTVTITTGEKPALVLSYPRDADPVFGADFSEVAQLPPHSQTAFTLGAGHDLLVTEAPIDDEVAVVPGGGEGTSSFAESEAA
jgi:hypothetical protein